MRLFHRVTPVLVVVLLVAVWWIATLSSKIFPTP